LIKRERRGPISAFQIAIDSPIYPDVRSLLTKLLGLGPQLQDALTNHGGIEHAFLYGSYASGQDSAHSDIDLFIVGPISSLELAAAVRPLLASLGRELNVVTYSRREVETRLATGDPFFLDVWAKPKVLLVGDESTLPQAPPPADVAPYFAQEMGVGRNWNTAAYVLACVPANAEGQLEGQHLDQVEDWVHSVRPDAVVQVATPGFGHWLVRPDGAADWEWQTWLYPGPVVSIRRALHPYQQDESHVISLADLVSWWRDLSSELPRLLTNLGCRRARLGLTVDTYGSDRRITGLDFDGLPVPRGVNSFQVPPWAYVAPDFELPEVPPSRFEQAARQLLRHWSYRGIDPTIGALGLS
jgi:predicted nucleotidyltransferase